jgi:DNA invertase Pin-like site-specific DNA recombinase
VQNNLESKRRQYALVDRARQLGWEQVEVIDDDLGRSGSGTLRPGFERLLASICSGKVGAVLLDRLVVAASARAASSASPHSVRRWASASSPMAATRC